MKTDVPTKHWSWLVAFMLIFIWSGVAPAERFTWLLEVLPAVIGLGLVVVSYRRFPLTDLLLFLLLIHATVLKYRYLIGCATSWGNHETTMTKLATSFRALYRQFWLGRSC